MVKETHEIQIENTMVTLERTRHDHRIWSCTPFWWIGKGHIEAASSTRLAYCSQEWGPHNPPTLKTVVANSDVTKYIKELEERLARKLILEHFDIVNVVSVSCQDCEWTETPWHRAKAHDAAIEHFNQAHS